MCAARDWIGLRRSSWASSASCRIGVVMFAAFDASIWSRVGQALFGAFLVGWSLHKAGLLLRRTHPKVRRGIAGSGLRLTVRNRSGRSAVRRRPPGTGYRGRTGSGGRSPRRCRSPATPSARRSGSACPPGSARPRSTAAAREPANPFTTASPWLSALSRTGAMTSRRASTAIITVAAPARIIPRGSPRLSTVATAKTSVATPFRTRRSRRTRHRRTGSDMSSTLARVPRFVAVGTYGGASAVRHGGDRGVRS